MVGAAETMRRPAMQPTMSASWHACTYCLLAWATQTSSLAEVIAPSSHHVMHAPFSNSTKAARR